MLVICMLNPHFTTEYLLAFVHSQCCSAAVLQCHLDTNAERARDKKVLAGGNQEKLFHAIFPE